MSVARVYLNQKLNDAERRRRIFDGAIFILSGLKTCAAICDHAMGALRDGFGTIAPDTAFLSLPVEEFVRIAASVKGCFTNGTRSKELLRDFANEMGMDPDEYYFDVPRLRIVPNYEYLHAGVSYAYAAHRDTWYGGPRYQINHWMPIMPITPDQTMSLYPAYFDRPIKNSSRHFDLTRWVTFERPRAIENIKKEQRVHPLPEEEPDNGTEIRFGFNAGDIMIFSGTHLHATVPNRSSVTRFSVDFRFFHIDDIRSNGEGRIRAPRNVDSEATSDSYGLDSLFHLGNFSEFGKKGQD
jgi:hypothetical protein